MLDPLVFGADRSQLLARLAQLNPPRSISQSYLFSRPGRVSAYLGPCISENPYTARRLIEECVQNTSCGWSWDLFPQNQEAVALARGLGFSSPAASRAHDWGKGIVRKGKRDLRDRGI